MQSNSTDTVDGNIPETAIHCEADQVQFSIDLTLHLEQLASW